MTNIYKAFNTTSGTIKHLIHDVINRLYATSRVQKLVPNDFTKTGNGIRALWSRLGSLKTMGDQRT